MNPVLRESDTVFVFRWAYGLQPPFIHRYVVQWGDVKEGDILVLKEPEHNRRVVKRCTEVFPEENSVFVIGENRQASRDSRHYGAIPSRRIEGKVILPP